MIFLFEHKCFLSANYMSLYNEWCGIIKIGSLWCDEAGKHNELKGYFEIYVNIKPIIQHIN